MINKILKRKEIVDNPPVLVDIGASGEIHAKWREIAPHSICVAFDADDREMTFTENHSSGFKKLISINRIVTDSPENEVDFYLTRSPFCSSTLEPDMDRLAKWPFQDLFSVEKRIKLKAVQLVNALANVHVPYIDWLKIDTQGTDLRLFKSIPEATRNRILAVEFEPGIIDAYKGEDKLYQVIHYMNESDFFMSDINVKGVARIDPKTISGLSQVKQRALRAAHRISPGWCEVTYLNTLSKVSDTRSYLLAYVFALVNKQYGLALEIAEKGIKSTGDAFFQELEDYALRRLSVIQFNWPFFVFKNKFNKAFNKIFG